MSVQTNKTDGDKTESVGSFLSTPASSKISCGVQRKRRLSGSRQSSETGHSSTSERQSNILVLEMAEEDVQRRRIVRDMLGSEDETNEVTLYSKHVRASKCKIHFPCLIGCLRLPQSLGNLWDIGLVQTIVIDIH